MSQKQMHIIHQVSVHMDKFTLKVFKGTKFSQLKVKIWSGLIPAGDFDVCISCFLSCVQYHNLINGIKCPKKSLNTNTNCLFSLSSIHVFNLKHNEDIYDYVLEA